MEHVKRSTFPATLKVFAGLPVKTNIKAGFAINAKRIIFL